MILAQSGADIATTTRSTHVPSAASKPASTSTTVSSGTLWRITSISSSDTELQCRYSVLLATPDRSATASTVTPRGPASTSSSVAAARIFVRLRATRGCSS